MKFLKIAFIFLMLLGMGISIYLYTSGPKLSESSLDVIETVLSSPIPEMIHGDTGMAKSQGIDIWYERRLPVGTAKGAVLLIMGISNDALGWPPPFIQAFVDSGYQVIRYDHRGTGMSDWMESWESDNPYSLRDMAQDGIEVLNALGIERAHVVGVSMGGMIAQELVINYPDRVSSLTSIMSSGFIEDPDLPKISGDVAIELIKIALKYGLIGGEKNMIKLTLASRIILMGESKYTINVKALGEAVRYNLAMRNGYNPNVSRQHQAAVYASGNRYEALKKVEMPSLIIHGKLDPFIPIEHGMKCASIIPNAEHLWVDAMGHDIPDDLIQPISSRIFQFIVNG